MLGLSEVDTNIGVRPDQEVECKTKRRRKFERIVVNWRRMLVQVVIYTGIWERCKHPPEWIAACLPTVTALRSWVKCKLERSMDLILTGMNLGESAKPIFADSGLRVLGLFDLGHIRR